MASSGLTSCHLGSHHYKTTPVGKPLDFRAVRRFVWICWDKLVLLSLYTDVKDLHFQQLGEELLCLSLGTPLKYCRGCPLGEDILLTLPWLTSGVLWLLTGCT